MKNRFISSMYLYTCQTSAPEGYVCIYIYTYTYMQIQILPPTGNLLTTCRAPPLTPGDPTSASSLRYFLHPLQAVCPRRFAREARLQFSWNMDETWGRFHENSNGWTELGDSICDSKRKLVHENSRIAMKKTIAMDHSEHFYK